jgi:DnaJ-class molecular chaperone
VEDGQAMRVNLGVSEVFVTFRVKPSDKFRRDKEDIHSDINVSIAQATLGGVVKVPGIYEDHVLQVREFANFQQKDHSILDSTWYTISSTFSSYRQRCQTS